MIQFKRGSKKSWLRLKKPLAAGQPGYDKDSHKIKIGNGKDLWAALPYASGLSAEEILNKESEARKKLALDKEDVTLITYGTEAPNKNTVGQLYLQYYDASPQADYVVSAGINRGWTYQKWNSGIARCSGTFELTTAVQSAIGSSSFYQNNTAFKKVDYPFTFKSIPNESATVRSPGNLVWLASAKGLNSTKQTALYSIISSDKLSNAATYSITIQVEGFWK